MINRSSELPGQALGPSLAPPHPGAAQVVLRASHPLCCMRRLLQHFSGFCSWMLWEQEFSVSVWPGFPQLPPLSVGMGRQRSSMGLLPWGGKGGYPHTIQEIWDLPGLRWISKSKTGTWQASAIALYCSSFSHCGWTDRVCLSSAVNHFFRNSISESLPDSCTLNFPTEITAETKHWAYIGRVGPE